MKVKLENIEKSVGSTNWTSVKKQTDADIERAAKTSEAKLLTPVELSQLCRTNRTK
jgi:hypothetical protein